MAWEAVRFVDLRGPYNIRIDTASNLRFGLLTEQEGLLVLGERCRFLFRATRVD